jgi:hypothetical protein
MEMSAFMTEHLKDHLKEQRDHDEQVRRGLEAKVEAQRVEMDKLREEAMQAKLELAERAAAEAERLQHAAKIEQLESVASRHQETIALQVRFEALHAAKMLSDVELHAVEDIIADSSDESSADSDGRVSAMLALSIKMPSDRAFARQVSRKFAAS